METPQDPREIITPDAFSVAPELLGKPLATPWRRGAAMAIDLVAISLLTRTGGFFLGLAASFFFLRLAYRSKGGRFGKVSRQGAFGCLGLLVLTITLATSWSGCFSNIESFVQTDEGAPQAVPFGEVGATVAELIALRGAESEEEARGAATQIAERLRGEGASGDEVQEVLEAIVDLEEKPWALDVIRTVALSLDSTEAAAIGSADSLALAYADAIQADDTARAGELEPILGRALASQDLDRLERRVKDLRGENDQLEQELDEAEGRGVIRWILKAADEVGIGFGWSGLYFTLFLTFFSGRTPGKRLLGIRVLRLDGKPIGWWVAFNRFGGYAASIFTGLLGFFEMFWDANRQALHDRIAATVVVKE